MGVGASPGLSYIPETSAPKYQKNAVVRAPSNLCPTLFITQPAVTKQIKALEDEAGTPLFDRTDGIISDKKWAHNPHTRSGGG